LVQRMAPDMAVSLSSEVLPEIGEFERTSTTVINAYLLPVVRSYLDSLLRRLRHRNYTGPVFMLQSGGGMMSIKAAQEQPVRLVESGPAAGVIATCQLIREMGLSSAIAFDMGGTTAKASFIRGGEVPLSAELEVGGRLSLTNRITGGGGYPIRIRVVDVAEVGAGGGSIIRIDKGGSLVVGPESAGAEPGPAAYGRGNDLPTVTDANIALGYLHPEGLAGGAIRLNKEAACRALRDSVAGLINLPLPQAAYGAHQVANSNMMGAIRAVSVQRGHDITDVPLVAFGGSGPVHAVEMARSLGIRTVILPRFPGLFSAIGLLLTDLEHEVVQSHQKPLAPSEEGPLTAALSLMEEMISGMFRDEGYDSEEIAFRHWADLRYSGQSFEITISIKKQNRSEGLAVKLRRDFEAEHERTFGHFSPEEQVEIVSLRVSGRIGSISPTLGEILACSPVISNVPVKRLAYFGPTAGFLETPVIDRGNLDQLDTCGPLLIEEYGSTIVVPPNCRAMRDPWNNIIVHVG
jgi:N-methylhydantoinase A